jgi:hypothetical protein
MARLVRSRRGHPAHTEHKRGRRIEDENNYAGHYLNTLEKRYRLHGARHNNIDAYMQHALETLRQRDSRVAVATWPRAKHHHNTLASRASINSRHDQTSPTYLLASPKNLFLNPSAMCEQNQ